MRIPKALTVLKASAGANWRPIKKHLLAFLLMKKYLDEMVADKKTRCYLERLVANDFLDTENYWKLKSYKQCSLEPAKLLSYTKNVLKTLHKNPYESEMACYISDSYNTKKSGNKKYPNLK